MSFTTRAVTHRFENADGTPASGAVEFTLQDRMTNNDVTIVPASVSAALAGDGTLSQTLTCNDDVGTVPTGVQWRVDMRIQGAKQETFYVIVPAGSGAVDLGSLLPSEQQVG